MIGLLQGSVVDREDNQISLLVAGVGYEVLCTLNAMSQVSASTDEVRLWTHLIVREDVLQLYGFADKKERALFRELIRISGVGPKVALSILSGMDCSGLVRAIHQGDAAILTKIPGIGKKTAERLVIEMRDRVQGWEVSGDLPDHSGDAPSSDVGAEAEAALIALGYKPVEATKMISAVGDTASLSVEDIIRFALQSRLKK